MGKVQEKPIKEKPHSPIALIEEQRGYNLRIGKDDKCNCNSHGMIPF